MSRSSFALRPAANISTLRQILGSIQFFHVLSISFDYITSLERERKDIRAGRRHDILTPARGVRHGRRFPKLIRREAPEEFARARIGRREVASVVTEENQPAGRGEHAAPGNREAVLRDFPAEL